jgi:uncharacterized protein YbjT (DUF2867 family)
MKIFVTGATGFVGQEVLKQLHTAGHQIRILARNPASQTAQAVAGRFQVEIQPGTLFDREALEKGVAGMNAVIHLVGIISEVGENTFQHVHVQGTQNVVAAVQRAGIERYIHMSALGTRPDGRSRYHQSKWLAEEAVRQSDLDYTIFRPSLIFGRNDQFVTLFMKIIRFLPVIPIMAREGVYLQPIAVEEVAAAFARSVSTPKSIGEIYDLCGPERLTFRQIIDAICKSMRRKRIKLGIPLSLSQKLASSLEFIFPRLFKKAPPLNRDQLIMLQEDNVGNAAPANLLFGLRPRPFQQGIVAMLNSKSD